MTSVTMRNTRNVRTVDPQRVLHLLAGGDHVLVDPTEARRCIRTLEQLERLRRGEPLLRSREGIRGARPAPPVTRRTLRLLRTVAAKDRPEPHEFDLLVTSIRRHGLLVMRRADYEHCEDARLTLKRELRRRRESGRFVEAERGPAPVRHRARGIGRCADCTRPPVAGSRRCRACQVGENAAQRARREVRIDAGFCPLCGARAAHAGFTATPVANVSVSACVDRSRRGRAW